MRVRTLVTMTAALAFAGGILAASPTPARAAAPKVAIIVGPVGATLTPKYIEWANATASAATAAGATVAKAYSPKATAASVLAAVAGANVVVYYGHGSGFPNPYSSTLDPNTVNGWGLQGPNAKGTHEDSWSNGTLKYYGEAWIAANARPAAGFVMIYANACYAPGASEGWDTPASESVAKARVGYYSRAPLNMGAGAYFATDLGASNLVSRIVTMRTTAFGDIFKMERYFSATALRRFYHPNVTGNEVWLHRSANWAGEVNYWYAFAGNPNRTPSGALVSPLKYGSPDSTAPTITSRSPASGATGVSVEARVTVTFSEPVTGVSGNNFVLRDTATATVVPALVTYDAATRRAVLTPSALLLPGRTYKVDISNRVRDAAGNALAWQTWKFTTGTGDTIAPKVTSLTPAPGATEVPTTTSVVVTFSEPVSGVWSGNFALRNTATATVVAATVRYDATTRTAVLTPSAPLAGGTIHKVDISNKVRDMAGNPLTWTSWKFTTAP